MRLLGLGLSMGLYALLSLHVYAYFEVIAVVLKRRVGTPFGLVWVAIGLSLLYNIIFNHFLAMTVKPGSPKDLIKVEKLRKETKHRENRKAVKVIIEGEETTTDDSDKVEDDRFEGLQKDVKRLIKYRTKTVT
jgi:hypothetical protein